MARGQKAKEERREGRRRARQDAKDGDSNSSGGFGIGWMTSPTFHRLTIFAAILAALTPAWPVVRPRLVGAVASVADFAVDKYDRVRDKFLAYLEPAEIKEKRREVSASLDMLRAVGKLREALEAGDEGRLLGHIGRIMEFGVRAYGAPSDGAAKEWPAHARSIMAEANFEAAAFMHGRGELRLAAKLVRNAENLARENEVIAEGKKAAIAGLAETVAQARKGRAPISKTPNMSAEQIREVAGVVQEAQKANEAELERLKKKKGEA